MCWFMIVGVSPNAAGELRQIGEGAAGLKVRDSVNSSVASAFAKQDVRLEITYGGCSCDLYAPVTPKEEGLRERERYRKKGWSASKIERAMQSRASLHAPVGRNPKRGRQAELMRAVTFVVEAYGSARLFAHLFEHEVDFEPIGEPARVRLSLQEYIEREGSFEPDAIVEVVRDAG